MDPVVIALVLLAAVAVALLITVRRRRLQERRAREDAQVRESLARVARDVQWDRSLRRLGAGKIEAGEKTETPEEESLTSPR